RAALEQLGDEGAIQVFRFDDGQMLLGAVGVLQFEVVAHRLAAEYGVAARIGPSTYIAARWVSCDDETELERFMSYNEARIARDTVDAPAFLAKMNVELDVAKERWPKIRFSAFREFGSSTFASVAAD